VTSSLGVAAEGRSGEGAVVGGFRDRVLRSKEGFLIGLFVCGREIRDVRDLVRVRCDICKREDGESLVGRR
jgi:hypothetical protein